MKIRVEGGTKFRELKVGDLFRYKSDCYFMVIPSATTNTMYFNAFNLTTNEYAYFADGDNIITVDGEVVVKC